MVFKIDLHTHILPRNIPDLHKKFGYGDFIQLRHEGGCKVHTLTHLHTYTLTHTHSHMHTDLLSQAKMYKGSEFFREVEDNCFDAEARLKDCDRDDVSVQVLSTVPVMFSRLNTISISIPIPITISISSNIILVTIAITRLLGQA